MVFTGWDSLPPKTQWNHWSHLKLVHAFSDLQVPCGSMYSKALAAPRPFGSVSHQIAWPFKWVSAHRLGLLLHSWLGLDTGCDLQLDDSPKYCKWLGTRIQTLVADSVIVSWSIQKPTCSHTAVTLSGGHRWWVCCHPSLRAWRASTICCWAEGRNWVDCSCIFLERPFCQLENWENWEIEQFHCNVGWKSKKDVVLAFST